MPFSENVLDFVTEFPDLQSADSHAICLVYVPKFHIT